MDFIKLRPQETADIKSATEESIVTYTDNADEGGMKVSTGEIKITYRSAIDYLSFPKLRVALTAVLKATKAGVHLEEIKAKKGEEKKAPAPAPPASEPAEPAPAQPPESPAVAKMEELKEPPPAAPAPPAPPPAKKAEPAVVDIPDMKEPAPLPQAPPPKPLPKREQSHMNRVQRANLAAANRPPAIEVQPPPQESESSDSDDEPEPLPPPSAAAYRPPQRRFGLSEATPVHPPAASASPAVRRFGFGK
jgi:hypothetical protein